MPPTPGQSFESCCHGKTKPLLSTLDPKVDQSERAFASRIRCAGCFSSMSQDSTNLDLLRSIAVLLVLFDHTVKFFGVEHLGSSDVNWLGRLGVAFFFVHTSLVLMLSLERTATNRFRLDGWRLPVNFYIRRGFRLLPLSGVVVLLVWAADIPQMRVLHLGFAKSAVSMPVLLSNLTLTQNLFVQNVNILGQLWSLPIELDMYLLLPALFFLARRWPGWFVTAAWPLCVGAALVTTHVASLWRINFVQFSPCFVPGVMAFVISKRVQPSVHRWLWPVLLTLLIAVFLRHSSWPMAGAFAYSSGLRFHDLQIRLMYWLIALPIELPNIATGYTWGHCCPVKLPGAGCK